MSTTAEFLLRWRSSPWLTLIVYEISGCSGLRLIRTFLRRYVQNTSHCECANPYGHWYNQTSFPTEENVTQVGIGDCEVSVECECHQVIRRIQLSSLNCHHNKDTDRPKTCKKETKLIVCLSNLRNMVPF